MEFIRQQPPSLCSNLINKIFTRVGVVKDPVINASHFDCVFGGEMRRKKEGGRKGGEEGGREEDKREKDGEKKDQ